MQSADSLEKTLMLGKIEGRRGWQRMRWLDVITNSMDMSLSKLQEIVRTGKPGAHGVAKSQTWLSDWTNKTDPKEVEIYELSEKEFRIILLSVLNYKNTQTTKQNREEMHEQNEKLNKEMKKKMKTDTL